MVGGLWRVLRGELETDQRRALWCWLWCSMALQQQRFPQFDIISEFLNAGDLGRLVSRCWYLRERRPILELRLRAMRRCSMNLAATAGMLAEELDQGVREGDLDNLLGFFGQVDQG